MLLRTLTNTNAEHLATYTRNPAVLGMIDRLCERTYPLSQADELKTLASQMPFSTQVGEAAYHIDRYGPSGLFRDSDPANSPFDDTQRSLKERFSGLESVRNALVVTAEIKRRRTL